MKIFRQLDLNDSPVIGSNTLILGDCLEVMKLIPDDSVDMVLTDPPYGTTACKWDSVIPLEPMWEQLKRISKQQTPMLLFGKEPFSSVLRTSNIRKFKYDWVWVKTRPGRYVQAKKMPLTIYELISVFYSKLPVYNPQMESGNPYSKNHKNTTKPNFHGKEKRNNTTTTNEGVRCPKDVIYFSNSNKNSVHPTQKPVELMEYMIKTYTNEGDTVLDFAMGSGTTGVACKNLNRSFIGIELNEGYFETAKKRIEDA